MTEADAVAAQIATASVVRTRRRRTAQQAKTRRSAARRSDRFRAMKLDGKTVLLTGATGGLGRAIATALGERGAKLILSSRRQADLDELAVGLPGGPHRTIVADLAEEGEALRLLEAAGEIDCLVANAGLPGSGSLESFSQEQIERALRVNLEGPMRMARELVPAMEKRGSGHLVFISSLSGRAATARASVYCAT